MSGHTDNVIDVDAPVDLVWTTTNRIELWPEMFSEYAAAEVLDEDTDRVRFRLETLPNELGRSFQWVSERELDTEQRVVRARRIDAGVFKFMHLFWEYLPTDDGGCRMRWVQDFEVRTDAPTDDAGMTDHLNRTTRTQQAHVKAYLEELARTTGARS